MLRRTLNLGILAHVDAGKTTLTERLLYEAGVIRVLGRVDDGTTQTDTMALEQERGITIKSAVVSFELGGVTVNLIDTPGHPDFIAEVERVLGVLDGAVLVISAVEGVQAQTPLLMRALQRLQVPTLLFVNKTDRRGADPQRVLEAISERLTAAATTVDSPERVLSVLAENDEALLEAYVDGDGVSAERLRSELAAQTRALRRLPGLHRLRENGRRRGEAHVRDRRAAAGARARPRRTALGERVQGRARPRRGQDRLRPPLLRHDRRARAHRRGAEGDRPQRLRERRRHTAAGRRRRVRSRSSGACATSGSATPSETGRAVPGTTSPRRRSSRSSSPCKRRTGPRCTPPSRSSRSRIR